MNKVKQLTFIAVYVAIIVALQTLLSGIVGIELTTLLFTVSAVFLPLGMTFPMVIVYCLIEGIMFGFGDWVLVYLIYWSFVISITYVFRKICKKRLLFFSLLNAIFGFLIGIFFAIEILIVYDLAYATSYYLNGVTSDVLHFGSNFLIALILFPVMQRIMPKIINFKI